MTTDTIGREFLLRQRIIDTASLLWPNRPGLKVLIWRYINDRGNDHFTATLFDPHDVRGHHRTQAVLLANANEAASVLGAAEELLEKVRELLSQVTFWNGCGVGPEGSRALDNVVDGSAENDPLYHVEPSA